jgi:Fic family protein
MRRTPPRGKEWRMNLPSEILNYPRLWNLEFQTKKFQVPGKVGIRASQNPISGPPVEVNARKTGHYVRKEAVASSQIEGTQSSLSDLLAYEIMSSPGIPVEDVREVSDCVG